NEPPRRRPRYVACSAPARPCDVIAGRLVRPFQRLDVGALLGGRAIEAVGNRDKLVGPLVGGVRNGAEPLAHLHRALQLAPRGDGGSDRAAGATMGTAAAVAGMATAAAPISSARREGARLMPTSAAT